MATLVAGTNVAVINRERCYTSGRYGTARNTVMLKSGT